MHQKTAGADNAGEMLPRERVMCALSRQDPDRMPFLETAGGSLWGWRVMRRATCLFRIGINKVNMKTSRKQGCHQNQRSRHSPL